MYSTFPFYGLTFTDNVSDIVNELASRAKTGNSDITCYKTEKDGAVTYQFDLPGCEKDAIQIDFTEGGKGLEVKATRKIGDTEIKLSTMVFVSGKLDINGDIKCSFTNGVLSVTIPPRKELQPRKLSIE